MVQARDGDAKQSPPATPGTALFPALPLGSLPPFQLFQQFADYWVDAWQRSVLFTDTLRQRADTNKGQKNDASASVLHFDFEMVLDGRYFPHPVNYQLMRIVPPKGTATDPAKRPFIVFDPRAGHGPGIGGIKPDSEIGRTLSAGHPCYFTGFLPEPVPTQTIEHVCEAEAIFVAKVIELHQEASQPCLIGNCQAGWQVAMMAALNPELPGVLILAGTPMSYWAGVHGKNPMRYQGGLLGGSWMASLWSDLGNGRFDGAWLIDNFEKLNPANTYWKKDFNLYSKVDTEAQRFLQFERWWGNPILLNGTEIQSIVDDLFVGNRFSTGKIKSTAGFSADLRNIKTPIVVFCSHADDITPPQQALDWILDLYRADEEIAAAGQTIIYCLHQSIGHLGIFVSSSVAAKEHDKFVQNIDLIETLPPGLYEAVFMPKDKDTPHADLASGEHVLRFEARRLEDIRALGCNSEDDDRCFATVRRVSESMQGMYETFMAPVVRGLVSEDSAAYLRQAHPMRVRYGMYSSQNPCMAGVEQLAEAVKQNRKPVSEDNFFWQLQESVSSQIVAALDNYRDLRDAFSEKMFLGIYGSPAMQAVMGLRSTSAYFELKAPRDIEREYGVQQHIHGLKELAGVGGLPEAMVRGLLYAVVGGKGFDEREFNMLHQLFTEQHGLPDMPQREFKALVRQQHAFLALDEAYAMELLLRLLDTASLAEEWLALDAINEIVTAQGSLTDREIQRLGKLNKLFHSGHTSLHQRATDIQVFNDVKTNAGKKDKHYAFCGVDG